MADCEHIRVGRQLAAVIADIATEREAARLTGDLAQVRDLEASAEATRRKMSDNYAAHQRDCEGGES